MDRLTTVTFSKRYNPELDKAYFYLIPENEEIRPKQIVWVTTDDGPKKVKVLAVISDQDKINSAKEQYDLKYCTAKKPETVKGVSRL